MIDKLDIIKPLPEKIICEKTDNYYLGSLSLCGNHGKENGDTVVFTNRDDDENVKLIIVADGVTNSKDGNVASKYVAERLKNIFMGKETIYHNNEENKGIKMYLEHINSTPTLKSVLLGKIRDINMELAEKYAGEAVTTLVFAVIGKKQTLIGSVGDSRIYTVKNRKMKLQTTDHLVWFAYNSSPKITTDQVKYLAGRSYIYKFIGGVPNPGADLNINIDIEGDVFIPHKKLAMPENSYAYMPDMVVLDNDEYDSLFACTDGVHGVVPSPLIEKSINEGNDNEILEEIARLAVNSDPLNPPAELLEAFKGRECALTSTEPGKDDVSMVLFKKYKNS